MKMRVLAVLVICVYAASAYTDDLHVSKAFGVRTREYVRLDASARGAARQGGIFTRDVTDDFEQIIKKAFSGKEGRNMRGACRDRRLGIRPAAAHAAAAIGVGSLCRDRRHGHGRAASVRRRRQDGRVAPGVSV